MPLYTDQMGHTTSISEFPQRIVSLVPSQSEYLWDLGLGSRIAGVTKFCIHPAELRRSASVVGGTKKLNLSKIASLKPDLIIGNREENEKTQIEALGSNFPVWMSEINTTGEALRMMEQLALITGKTREGENILGAVTASLRRAYRKLPAIRVAYFIWKDPWMLAGSRTFISDLLSHLGFLNVASEKERYPAMDLREVRSLRPEVCLLSSEPYPFSEKHAALLQQTIPESKVLFVDGESLSWYGSRLRGIADYADEINRMLTRG